MDPILISFIIPFYNVEQFIQDCLLSIIDQTTENPADFEILCIDDGSQDNSANIIYKLQKENPHVNLKVIQKANGGVSSARNLGLSNASGKYVWFVDSDDFLPKNAIKYITPFLHGQYDVISGLIEPVDESSKYNEKFYFSKFSSNHGHCSSCIRRKFLIERDIRYNENLKYGEDLIFFEFAIAFSKRTKKIKKLTYCYRTRAGSAMNSGKSATRLSDLYTRLPIYNQGIEKLKEEGIKSNYLIRRKNEVVRNILFHTALNNPQNGSSTIKKLEEIGEYPYSFIWDNLYLFYSIKDSIIKYACFLFPIKHYYTLFCKLIQSLHGR